MWVDAWWRCGWLHSNVNIGNATGRHTDGQGRQFYVMCIFPQLKVRCLSQADSSLCVSKLGLFPQSQPCSAKSALTLRCNWFVPLDVTLYASPHGNSVIERGSPKQNATFQNKTTNNSVTFYCLKRKTWRVLYQVSQPWENNQARNIIFMVDKPSSVRLEWHQTSTILTDL